MAAFFYDSQIRRFLTQFARIMSNWNVTRGKDPAGNDILVRVPVMYGDSSRQAATIIANNSENNIPSAPLITYYISGLEYDQKRTQDPYFIDKLAVRQRKYNPDTKQYETVQGDAFTVERIMPVPYTLRITVDFWTSNNEQKMQLVEQLGVLFNPSMEIQSTDNFIDWTSLSVVYQDGLNYTSRSIPQGSGNPIDVLSWKFYMPIWLSSSAKVKKLGIIHKIINSIFDGNTITDMQDDDLLMGTRQKVTPYGYQLLLIGNSVQLLPGSQPLPDTGLNLPDSPNTTLYWQALLNVYGTVRPGISQLWIQHPHMDTEIVGTIEFNPNDDRLLVYTIDPDTLPQNTLDAVTSVINPGQKGPNAGLPPASLGQRYLILQDIPYGTVAWGNITAKTNDIIEYNGVNWVLSFDSNTDNVEFVTNLTTSVQYRYSNRQWVKAWEGFYDEGSYSIVI